MELKRRVIAASSTALFLVSAMAGVGCTEPIEPGSDLPEQAGDEILGPVLSVDLEGEYALVTTLPAEDGGEGMTLPLTLKLVQQGEDSAMDMSTLTGNLSLLPGVEADSIPPTELNKYGRFKMKFEKLVIPGAIAQMDEDLELDITLEESQALEGGDCIYGMFVFPIMTMGLTIPVESTYTAQRKGSTGECKHPDETEETEEDMGGMPQ